MSELSNKDRLLRRYLDRYRHIINRLHMLKQELHDVEDDFNTSAFHAVVSDGMSHGTQLSNVPTYILKTSELREKIMQRQLEAIQDRDEIIHIINMLPTNTPDQMLVKDIIEAKYIGMQSEDTICYDLFNISQRTYYRKVDEGINYLVKLPEVIKAVNLFAIKITFPKKFLEK